MHESDCEISAEAFASAIPAQVLEIDPPRWQKADLAIFIDANATLGDMLIEQCVHLEQIIRVEQSTHDVPPFRSSSSNLRINTIRAINLASNDEEGHHIASSSHEVLMLEGGQAYEVAMLALYLASRDATAIADAVIDIPAGRYLS
ncbi:hypothetical protein [uncultured Oxalicibacterium sp.]|uniref:hypothetical protein n=1 Tax=uncultured Oxalicibacterium sp. TaxID=1168540 RepID=UPI0025D48BE1|nr:hypothetical protein [uncultured Oxalicibacterium sp.]